MNDAMIGVAIDATSESPDFKNKYLEALTLIERLHRRLLDVIKDEFERRGDQDINAVQALLLFNMGGQETYRRRIENTWTLSGLQRLIQPEETRADGVHQS